MKKKVKPVIVALAIIFCLQLSGCFDSRELDTIGIVMGTAIDKAEAPEEGFTVTIQIASPSKGGSEQDSPTEKDGSGGGAKDFLNISQSGKTINFIIREMQNKMSRMIYVAHSQNIVFGEELAKQGVKDSLDFFARAPESRMSQLLFVAEGNASDILRVQPEFESMPTTMLTKMLRNQKLTSEAPVVTVFEFLCCMIRKTKCPVMPIVRIVEDEDNKRLEVDGCAVFKNNSMIGNLDEAQTRGLLFIEDKVKAGVLSLTIEDAEVTAEIRKSKSKVKPVLYENGLIEYNLEVDATIGVGDQTGTINLANPDNVPKLLTAAEEAIKNEIQSAVDQSKNLNADIFGFGEYIKRKYPTQWPDIESSWEELYPDVTVNITVKAHADGSGAITEPLIPEEV